VTYVTNAERIGRQIGLKDGAEERSKAIALRMLKKGMDLETIAELTQLSPAQLQQLQTQLPQT
jgi:predicted transposase/invertase (TIGR01784 family)